MSKIKFLIHLVFHSSDAIFPSVEYSLCSASPIMSALLISTTARILSDSFGLTDVRAEWSPPEDPQHGDLATAVALQAASRLKKKPREIADALVAGLSSLKEVETVEVAGPGYVNVRLTPEALLDTLKATRAACTAKVKRAEKPVIVEYSQPNIAKPLGAHHLLTTTIGQAISNLYEHDGANVLRWNYLGDWGTQFGKLAIAVQKWAADKTPADLGLDGMLQLYVRFHDEAEKDATLEDAAREAFRKLEDGDAAMHAFWEQVVDVTKSALAPLYKRLHVAFDTDKGESFYSDKMEPVIEEGIDKGVFKEGKEGALIAEFPEESNLPPYLIRKGDGATLYSTRDLAQMRYRMDECDPGAIYIVTDVAQKLHFEQLVATCEQLGWALPEFENVLTGRMRFADKKMSTRKGNILKLEEVLDEAVARAKEVIDERGDAIQTDDPADLAEMMGVGSVSYGILSQNRKMDIVFDWGKFLSFDGNSAPYLQYTHARACSVLRKAGEVDEDMPAIRQLTEKEREMIRTLAQYPQVLEQARTERLPHKLANYLFSLAQAFNGFYNSEPILQAEQPARSLRLALTRLTRDVLRSGAALLTLRLPERM